MLTLEKYLEQKGFTEKKMQTVKAAMIEVLMAISAFDSSTDDIKQSLKLNWNRIIGTECKAEDNQFIDEFDFKYQNYVLYDKIKYHGFDGIKNKSFCLDYIKSVWYFCYLGINYEKVDRDDINVLLESLKKQEKDNGFIKEDRYYVLDQLHKRYSCYSDRAREIGEKISDKYLDELKDIFHEALDMLIDEDDRYSELEHIFVLNEEKPAVKAVKESPVVAPKQEEVKVEAPVKEPEVVENDEEEEPTDELAALLIKIKEEHANEIQKMKEAYESKVKALEYEIDLERARYEQADEEIKRARIKGAEEILLTLNSDSYSCILDKLYDIKVTQNFEKDEIINLSVQFYNALKALGYKTIQWHGQKCGDTIPSDIPVTDLRKLYRWDEELNLDGKERVVQYPGLKFHKSRLVVYNPKIDEKK